MRVLYQKKYSLSATFCKRSLTIVIDEHSAAFGGGLGVRWELLLRGFKRMTSPCLMMGESCFTTENTETAFAGTEMGWGRRPSGQTTAFMPNSASNPAIGLITFSQRENLTP